MAKGNKTIEVTVCDVCGEEANHRCPCEKDICSKCGIRVGSVANYFFNDSYLTASNPDDFKPYGTICRTHIESGILEKLGT